MRSSVWGWLRKKVKGARGKEISAAPTAAAPVRLRKKVNGKKGERKKEQGARGKVKKGKGKRCKASPPLSIRSPIVGSQQRQGEIGKHLSQSKHRPSLLPHGGHGLAGKKIAVAVVRAAPRG